MENSQVIKVSTDKELEEKSKKDDYWISRIFKFFILGAVLVVLGVILVGFIYRFIVDPTFQDQILGLVKNNIVGIVFFCLGILGIKYTKDKESK